MIASCAHTINSIICFKNHIVEMNGGLMIICRCGLLIVVMAIRVFSFHWAWFNENPSIKQLSSCCHERRKGGGEVLYPHTASS